MRHICRQLGCLLVLIAFGFSSVAATPLCKQAPATQRDHLRQIWQDNSNDLWFFTADGQKVIPRLSEEWLAVRFNAAQTTNSGMPEVIRQFNQRYDEATADVVYNPAQPDLAMYRFKPSHRRDALTAILAGDDPNILYVLPAVIVDGKARILGERISIRWKSQLRSERRLELLRSIGATDYTNDLSGREEEIVVDPSRMPVWQAANRLAEDVQVVSATPELLNVDPPVTVHFQVDSLGTVAGAAMPFSLDISFNNTVNIEPGTIANLNVKPQEIFRNLFAIDYDIPLSSVDVRHSPIQLRGKLYLYANGEYELPSIPIFYRVEGSDPNKIYQINTPPVTVRTAALIPSTQGDYRLQVPSQQSDVCSAKNLQPSPLSYAGLWQALIGVVLFIAGSVYALRHRARCCQQPTVADKSTTTQQLHQSLATAMSHQQLRELANLGKVLRGYLIERFAAGDLPQGGGAEQFYRQLRPCLPQPWQQRIYQILQVIDDTLARRINDAEVAAAIEQIEQLVVDLEPKRPDFSSNDSVSNVR
jgi:hypothetical protein